MFSKAKVGDRVFDYTLQEWGNIVSFSYSSIYPIKVEISTCVRNTILVSFKNNIVRAYTTKGTRNNTDKLPTLFWNEVKPKLEIDTPILVWRDDGLYKYKRYFSHFDSNGNIHCFAGGTTGLLSDGKTTKWDNWKLVE